MITTLTGSNSFAMQNRLKELTNAFVKKHGNLALEKIDGERANLIAIKDALQSLPFLAARKMVVIRDLSANKAATGGIEQLVSAIDVATDVIFYEPMIDKRTTFFKVLHKQTELEEFRDLDPARLKRWLLEEAKKQGGQLSSNDADYLIERVGTDQWQLYNELEKLITYQPGLTRQNIELLTEPSYQSKIFELLDAAFAGDKKNALRLYEEQRAQKVEPQAILAMIAWQLSLLVAARLGKGKQPAEIAKDLSLNAYPVSKAMRLSTKLSDQKLRRLIDDAFNIDLKNKTSAIELDEALKTYIVTI